jgi:hypothetical protein
LADRKSRLLRRLRAAGIHARLAGCSGSVARVRAARLLAAAALAAASAATVLHPVTARAAQPWKQTRWCKAHPDNPHCHHKPPVDTDGDGVPDAQDACPTKPGPASNHGCPVDNLGAIDQLPPGAVLPASAPCADLALQLYGNGEVRPDNADENVRPGIGSFGGHVDGTSGDARYGARVQGDPRLTSGAFLTSTRSILAWGACKWGLDDDLTFARAVVESSWHMSTAGDGGHSHGLLQINDLYHDTTTPMSYERTPFSVDYAEAWQRACVDGDFGWLGGDYASSTGDRRTWGCIGAWFSGNWQDGASQQYQGRVRTELAARRWEQPGF